MKIKPVVFEKIQTTHTSFEVDFKLDYNITFIKGDSGVGKSAVYSFLEEMSAEDKRIRCFNYLDMNRSYKNSIKAFKGKMIVIDNADLLLNNAMRNYIAHDNNNQYMIIGRNPEGLQLSYDEMYELVNCSHGEITEFSLKRECL